MLFLRISRYCCLIVALALTALQSGSRAQEAGDRIDHTDSADSIDVEFVDPLTLERLGVSEILRRLYLRESDFGFRDDYMPSDSFALKRFLEYNHKPLELSAYAAELRAAAGRGFEAALSRCAQDTEAEFAVVNPQVAEPSHNLLAGVNLYYRDTDLNYLLSTIYPFVEKILPAATDSALANLSETERAFLIRRVPELLLEEELAFERDVFTHDSLQQVEREDLKQFVSFARKFRPEFLVGASRRAAVEIHQAVEDMVSSLRSRNIPIKEFLTSIGEIPAHSRAEFLGVRDGWKISGTENDTHRGDFTVLIDFGGDDHYDLSYDPTNPHPSIVIDLGGNDTYSARGSHSLGGSMFSLGLLIDWDGSDVYNGENFTQGSGLFGCGVLYDRSGDDRYSADTYAQGAGGFGFGLLYDESGRDIYSGSLFAQALGFTQGVGLLIDREGNDNYIAGDKYSDVLRYDNHYLSLSQGFGYGLRPFLSGGIGALIDLSGADTYKADIFGQGCSYWRGIGLIVEGAGNDDYLAYQYAQGSATHMTLGALVDYAGDDSYQSKGVSQGCGHDYSYGLLADYQGDDLYYAVDLSQAAGSANGVGALFDIAGDDRYHIENPKNTHGYGNPRREFGSLGLMLDLEGVDEYDGHGRDNSLWRADGRWGGGLDCQWREWLAEGFRALRSANAAEGAND